MNKKITHWRQLTHASFLEQEMSNHTDCPVHKLHDQTISESELRFYMEQANNLHICNDCLQWIRLRLQQQTNSESKNR